MITINKDKFWLFLLILSCILDGAAFELVFFMALGVLIFHNRAALAENKYYKWFILIICLYCALLILNLFYFHATSSWRAVGITKTLCAFSLCILMSDHLCESDIETTFLFFLILFNFYYFVNGTDSDFQNINIAGITNFPSANTLSCLNMMFLPHVFTTLKRRLPFAKLIYFVSLLWIFINYAGSTLYISLMIFIALELGRLAKESLRLRRHGIAKAIRIAIPLAIGACVLSLVLNNQFQNFYLEILKRLDKDRFEILSDAINRLSNISKQELIWGKGDNNFQMLSGRHMVAHNFILEVSTFEGLAGLAVLAFETVVFWIFIMDKIKRSPAARQILLSILFGYIFFMLHPVYTSSFLVKMYLVLLNMRAYYIMRAKNTAQFALASKAWKGTRRITCSKNC